MAANAGEIRARLVLSNDEFKNKMNEARNDMKKTGFSAQQMSKDFGAIQKGSLAVGGAVVAAIGGSVKIASEFEQGMARVKAISGATGEEFQRLEDAARKAGAETIFSATDGADALSYLAMAGFSVNEQISALPAVLNAAIAGQVDLADSADMVSNIMTGFGISAEDAGHAVDVLVMGFTTANTDLNMLADGMKYVAPVAKALGWSIEDTTTALGKLSDAGIQGSQSGTVLRASLLSLANPTGQTAKTMKKLNIEVTDAEGKMKPLPELMGHISEKMAGMTDAQRTQAAAQLVGTQAASGFLALLDVGEDELARYSKALENSTGKAQEMADIQADTLVGSFKEFQSAMEEAGIKLGKEFLPVFTDIVRWGTEIVGSFDDVNVSQAKSVIAFAGTAAAIGLTISTLGKLVIAVRGLMVSMGPAGWLIAGVSILGGLIATSAVNTEDLSETMERLDKQFDEATSLDDKITQFDELQAKSRLTTDEFAEFIDITDRISKETDTKRLEELRDRQEELYKNSGMSNEELDKMVTLNDELVEAVSGATEKITDQGNAIIDNTEAAKDFNKEQYEMIRLELEAQKTQAESKMKGYLRDEKDLQEKINKLQDKKNGLLKDQKTSEESIGEYKAKLAEAQERNDAAQEAFWQNQLNAEEVNLDIIKDKIAKNADLVLEKAKELEKTQENIDALDTVNKKMIDLELKQVGLNAKKGEEVETIEAAIRKLDAQKEKLEKNTDEAFKNTDEFRAAKQAINDQIGELNGVYSRITEITGNARSMNDTLGKPVYKSIQYKYTHTGNPGPGLNNSARPLAYHTGGIVGHNPINQMPKLHMGGLASQFASTPLHNEIDVRLLRNEMVLTEAQQANLMRMIDGGQGGQSAQKNEGISQADFKYLVDAINDLASRPASFQINDRELVAATKRRMREEILLDEEEDNMFIE